MAEKLVATITVRDDGANGTPQTARMSLDTGNAMLGNYVDASDALATIVETYSCGLWTRRADVMSHEQGIPTGWTWPTIADEPYLKVDQKAVLFFDVDKSLAGSNLGVDRLRMELPAPKKANFENTPEGLRVKKTVGDDIATELQNKLTGIVSCTVSFVEGYLKSKK